MATGGPPVEFKGGFFFMKELQRVVAFRAYEAVVSKGRSKKLKELHAEAFEKYHGTGSTDSVGLAEKCMRGMEMFETIYESIPNPVTGHNDMVLKPSLHCLGEDKTIISHADVNRKGINMSTLSIKRIDDRSLITGRTIWEWGKEVEATGRKVLAIVNRSQYKDGTLPSGQNWEDYLKYCRYKYWEASGAGQKETEQAPDSESGPKETEQAPDSEEGKIKNWTQAWSFPGFMAWALWGRIPPPGMDETYKAKCFWARDETKKGDKSNSRKAARNEQRATTPMSSERGLSHRDHLMLASNMQFNEVYEEQSNLQLRYNLLNKQLEQANRDLASLSAIVAARPECFDDPERHQTWPPFRSYQEATARKTKALDKMEEIQDHIENKKKRSIHEFMDKVYDESNVKRRAITPFKGVPVAAGSSISGFTAGIINVETSANITDDEDSLSMQ